VRILFLVIIYIVSLATRAVASETDWQPHLDMLQTRLIASSVDTAKKETLFAWEAKLEPGWKTYWRSPGEAGLPVKIFIAGEEQEVLYPYPERFELFGLETYGYSKYVVLPFVLTAKQISSGVPVEADFMVCKDICVPFHARYDLKNMSLDGPSIHDQKIQKWLKKIPAKEGGDGVGLEVLSAKVVGPVGREKLIVDAKADVSLGQADMLAEVNGMFHFGKPATKLLADGKSIRFVLSAMTGKTPLTLRGEKVRLTFTDGHGASIERTFQLAAGISK